MFKYSSSTYIEETILQVYFFNFTRQKQTKHEISSIYGVKDTAPYSYKCSV